MKEKERRFNIIRFIISLLLTSIIIVVLFLSLFFYGDKTVFIQPYYKTCSSFCEHYNMECVGIAVTYCYKNVSGDILLRREIVYLNERWYFVENENP